MAKKYNNEAVGVFFKILANVAAILAVFVIIFIIIQSVNGGRPLSPGFTSEVVSTIETLSSSA